MPIESYNSANEKALLEKLRELGGKQITDQSGIRTHQYSHVAKPEAMSNAQLAKVAASAAAADDEETAFTRTFKYRPWDGANAFQNALMKVFGHSGNGMATQSFFGKTPPQKVSIEVGPDQTIQVPWGRVEFPILEGYFELGGVHDEEFGSLFSLTFIGPKRKEAEVEGVFKIIADELQSNSIYRGKAFNGADMPSFLNPDSVDRKNVVYAKEVERSLIGLLWHPIRYTQRAREQGISLKRSILLGGPYGTGKSLAAMLTAQEALQNGWTFIQCRPGRDDLDTVMKTAQLYQPAVVFYEDVDTIAQDGDPENVQMLLDTFDGISNKGTELIVVLTTNHVSRIHKGMLRPGRMDGVIEIGPMDAYGAARLVMNKMRDKLAGDITEFESKYPAPSWELDIPGSLSDDLDLDIVAAALATLETPSFIDEAIRRVMLYCLHRPGYKATTQDFLDAVESLSFQYELYTDAGEGTRVPTIDAAFQTVLENAISSELPKFKLEQPDLRLAPVSE